MWREKLLGITGFATVLCIIGIMGLIVFAKNIIYAGNIVIDASYFCFKNGLVSGFILSIGLIMVSLGLFFVQRWARWASIIVALIFQIYFVRLLRDFFVKTEVAQKSDSLLWIFVMTPLFIYSVFGLIYFVSIPVKKRFDELKEILKK